MGKFKVGDKVKCTMLGWIHGFTGHITEIINKPEIAKEIYRVEIDKEPNHPLFLHSDEMELI